MNHLSTYQTAQRLIIRFCACQCTPAKCVLCDTTLRQNTLVMQLKKIVDFCMKYAKIWIATVCIFHFVHCGRVWILHYLYPFYVRGSAFAASLLTCFKSTTLLCGCQHFFWFFLKIFFWVFFCVVFFCLIVSYNIFMWLSTYFWNIFHFVNIV